MKKRLYIKYKYAYPYDTKYVSHELIMSHIIEITIGGVEYKRNQFTDSFEFEALYRKIQKHINTVSKIQTKNTTYLLKNGSFHSYKGAAIVHTPIPNYTPPPQYFLDGVGYSRPEWDEKREKYFKRVKRKQILKNLT